MPGNKDWGPPLWRLLHGLAEYLGNQNIPMMATDEAHEIVFILKDIEKILPCAICRAHYAAYRKSHSVESFHQMRGYTLREAVRKWLYTLHEDVNRDKSVQSNITLDTLPELYKSVDLKAQWAEFFQKIKLSTEVGLVSQSALENFHRHLGMMRKLLGK
jgi:hypothetical protein